MRDNREMAMKFAAVIAPAFKSVFRFEQEISTILTDTNLDFIDVQVKLDEAKDNLIASWTTLLLSVVSDDETKEGIIIGTKLLRPHIDEMLNVEIDCVRAVICKATGKTETGDKIYMRSCDRITKFAEDMIDTVITISDEVHTRRDFSNAVNANSAENKLAKKIISVVQEMEGTKGVGVGKGKVISEINKIIDEKNKEFSDLVKENNR